MMDTLSFFRLLVPDTGFRFVTALKPSRNGRMSMHHMPVVEFDQMVDEVRKNDAAGFNTYYAMASYKEVKYNEFEHPVGREQANALHVKCLWQDFDVGKQDTKKSYASRNEALEALKRYVREVGLPTPMLVNSGYGLHAYWPFSTHVTASEWEDIAKLQRVIFAHMGVKYDSSRDKDCASVLRPIGAHNYKEGEAPKEVKLVTEGDRPTDPQRLKEILQAYLDKHSLGVPLSKQSKSRVFNVSDDLVVENDYPPSSMAIAVEHCHQLMNFRDTGGESEPEWYSFLGLAKHFVDGEALAHEWSSNDQRYDQAQTQSKMDHWSFGPTTCEKFNDMAPERCSGCAFMGKIRSPIQLGYETPTEAPTFVETTDSGEKQEFQPEIWPEGYSCRNGKLSAMVPDPDTGVPIVVDFAHPPFYPITRVRTEDGTYAMVIRAEMKKGQWREFEIPTRVTNDGRSFRMAVGDYEVHISNDKLAIQYMSSYKALMRQRMEEVNTFTQFGWHNGTNGFLIGNKIITKDGVNEVRISANAVKDDRLRGCFEVKGTKEEWVEGVDKLYNRPGMEPYQYAIATMFGSILVPLLGYEQWNGIPLALTSDRTSFGKSTVALIAINGLYNANKAMVSDTTAKAIIGRASNMGNLVILFDEVTKSLNEASDLSDILYSLSNGRQRIGMQSDGTERKSLPPFKLNSIITGNRNILFQLTEAKHNPEATQMRVFEVDLQDYYGENPPFSKKDEELALHLVNNVTGVLAVEYVQYVINNAEMLKERLHQTAMAVSKQFGDNSSKERFYSYHIACSLVGLWVARKLDMIRFSISNVRDWSFGHVEKMRHIANEYQQTPMDSLAAFLADLHGCVLVTKGFNTLNPAKTEVPILPMRGPLLARLVLGNSEERGQFYIAVKALDDWGHKNNVSSRQLKRQLFQEKLIRGNVDADNRFSKKVSLGRGVPTMPAGQSRCIEVDFSAAQGYIRDYLSNENVFQLDRPGTAAVAGQEPANLAESK